MQRNEIDMYYGAAHFVSLHTVEVASGHTITRLTGEKFVIAVGSVPAQPVHLPFTPGRIIDSDGILALPTIPRTMVVVGAGIIGCEYGPIFATLGVEVTVVDSRDRLMEFVDCEIVETLTYHMRRQNIMLRLEEAVTKVFIDNRDRVITELESGKRIVADTLLFSIGAQTPLPS
jgi:NAD(P) transhydrogenase